MKKAYILPALALLLVVGLQCADAQGPIRRLLFGRRTAPACGQCEATPNNFRDITKVSACPCKLPTCPECCKDGTCDVPSVSGLDIPLPVPLLPMRMLDGKAFAGSLQQQIMGKRKLSAKPLTHSLNGMRAENRILNILNAPDSPRRDRQVAQMERHVRVHLNLAPTAAIDWSTIDWATLLQSVLQLLILLLPLFA